MACSVSGSCSTVVVAYRTNNNLPPAAHVSWAGHFVWSMMMGRKPHYGEGSVFERKDGRYEAVVPNFGGTGKRKSFYGKTKTEARKKRDEALKQLARGEYVDVSKMKTGEYLDYWESVHG